MKLILEPKVYLVGSTIICPEGVNAFLRNEGVTEWSLDSTQSDQDSVAEVAGRVCYMSFSRPRPGGNEAYLKNILSSGHGSVLEHVSFNMILTGISRTLSHELVRHRVGVAYSQLSQRYVDSSDVAFVVPPEMLCEVQEACDLLGEDARAYFDANIQEPNIRRGVEWLATCVRSLAAYRSIADSLQEKIMASLNLDHRESISQEERTDIRKKVRQTARSVLPGCTETKIFLTGNVRAFRHLLEMRAAGPAEVEIRRLFNVIFGILVKEAPNSFNGYTRHELPDGTFEVRTPWRKV